MAKIINPSQRAIKNYPGDDRWMLWDGTDFRPYNNVAEAISNVPSGRRHIGLFAVVTDKLYWYKSGIADTDLVPFNAGGIIADFIPLTGTEEGKPITGNLEIGEYMSIKRNFTNEDGEQFQVAINIGENYLQIQTINEESGEISFMQFTPDSFNVASGPYNLSLTNGSGIMVEDNSDEPRGIRNNTDFSDNIDNLDYVQKIYVDRLVGDPNKFIPLHGTQTNKPLDGDFDVAYGTRIKCLSAIIQWLDKALYLMVEEDGNIPISLIQLGEGIKLQYGAYNIQLTDQDGIAIDDTTPNARGLRGSRDYTPNIEEFDYTQKKYVDEAIGNISTTPGATGIYAGTGEPFTDYEPGDIIYANAENTLTKLPKGKHGETLRINGSGLPSWGYPVPYVIIFIANTTGDDFDISYTSGTYQIEMYAEWLGNGQFVAHFSEPIDIIHEYCSISYHFHSLVGAYISKTQLLSEDDAPLGTSNSVLFEVRDFANNPLDEIYFEGWITIQVLN